MGAAPAPGPVPAAAEARLLARDRVATLREAYGALLTERQRELLAWYYDLDLSLGEIAQQVGVSRQAVHDLLRRALRGLESYERRLQWAQRAAARQTAVAELLRAIEVAERGGGAERLQALRRAAALARGLLVQA